MQLAGCDLLAVEEYDDRAEAWEPVDLRGLPRQLLIVGQRRAGDGRPQGDPAFPA